MGDNVTFNEEDIQSFIDIADNDKDGKISKPELIEFIMDLFNSMDVWGVVCLFLLIFNNWLRDLN